MKLKQRLAEKLYLDCALFGAIAGAIIFVAIYGLLPLDVTNDQWIINGYVENDVRQHYAGWLAFRSSDWSFPLGYMNNLAYPTGTYVSYTDSIPLVAIFFKMFSGILPKTFQYFGIYILLCFMLQGVAATFLMSEFTDCRWIIKISSLLFVLSPIMIERAFRHTSLASHFLILFALFFYFHSKHHEYKSSWGFSVLLALAMGIHPYFLPMVFGIFCANILEMLINKQDRLKTLVFFVGSFVPCVVMGLVIGAIGTGVSGGDGSFGHFSMNINAIINPLSFKNIDWSSVLEPLPQTRGNYDGFNYLGIGVLLGCIGVVMCVLCGKIKINLAFIKRHLGMIIAAIVFCLFAISNVVTLNDNDLVIIRLPEEILKICSIFRASGRMFYPDFYLIYLVVILCIISCMPQNMVMGMLCLLLCVQTFDFLPALRVKHNSFDSKQVEQIYIKEYADVQEYWSILAKDYSEVRFFESEGVNVFNYLDTAIFLGKAGFEHSNIQFSSRGNMDNSIAEKAVTDLVRQDYEKDVLYATINESAVSLLERYFAPELRIYDLNGCFVICEEKMELAEVEFLYAGSLALADFTDNNWECGVLRANPTSWLFEKNPYTEQALRKSSYLYGENATYVIVDVQMNEAFINVNVENVEAISDVAYPARLTPSLDK